VPQCGEPDECEQRHTISIEKREKKKTRFAKRRRAKDKPRDQGWGGLRTKEKGQDRRG